MHHFQGRSFDAVIAEALSLGRDVGDAWVVSFARFMQGLAALERCDYEQATAYAHQALEAADDCGEEVDLPAGPLMILGNIAVLNGDYDRAQQLYDEGTAAQRRAGEVWGLSILLSAAAGLRIVRQDFAQARAQASEALSLCEELDDPRGIAWSLDVFAGLLAAGGHADGAARLWGASERLLESLAGLLSPEVRWIRDRYLESVKKSLGAESFEAARAEGRAMPLVHATALARQQALLLG
jgi:non-specific serine/threonine protein kinase